MGRGRAGVRPGGVNATQIVLGVSRRRSWQYVFGPGVSATVARESGPDLDVHIVTHDAAAKGRGLPIARRARLGRSRIIWGWVTGIAGPALLTLLLSQVVPELGLANDMLLFLTCTVAAALLGGLLSALASAAFGSLLLNYFFTPPLYQLTIADPKNIVAIAIFVGVAVSVASVVDLAARRTHQAARLRAESEILSFLAGSVLRGEDSLDALLERLRETFSMDSAALLERASEVDAWTTAAAVGSHPVSRPPTPRRAPCPTPASASPARREDAGHRHPHAPRGHRGGSRCVQEATVCSHTGSNRRETTELLITTDAESATPTS